MRLSKAGKYSPDAAVLYFTNSPAGKIHAVVVPSRSGVDFPTTNLCASAQFSYMHSTWGVRGKKKDFCKICAWQLRLWRRSQALYEYYAPKGGSFEGGWADKKTANANLAEGHRRLAHMWIENEDGNESAWCEHIKGNLYRAMNECLNSLPANFPKGSEYAKWNGKHVRVRWGSIFTGREGQSGYVRPIEIVGLDESDTGCCPKCIDSSVRCTKESTDE